MIKLIITFLILSSVAYASEERAAGRAVAEALIVSTGIDKRVQEKLEQQVSDEYKPAIARTITVLDIISKQKVILTWTF